MTIYTGHMPLDLCPSHDPFVLPRTDQVIPRGRGHISSFPRFLPGTS